MADVLSPAERRILEAACDTGVDVDERRTFSDAVRRRLGQLPGPDFRRGVASLADRGLLRARVATKPDGDIGRVVIEAVTPLGRSLVRPRSSEERPGPR